MKVLVTGGSGWIGQATVNELLAHDIDVVTLDRTAGGLSALRDDENKPQPLDVTNQTHVYDAVSGVDHVIHLAGLLGTHELLDRMHEAVEVNVIGSVNVITACSKYGVGLTQITMPRVNPSLYAATKSCAMDISEALRIAGDLRVSYVRAYNAYGPGQAYGGDHPQKIIPTFASRAWRGLPLPVWGDGMLWVDLVHVTDVARMLVAAIDYVHGEVFDAGTGYVQTVLEVAHKVISLTGNRSEIEYLPPRKGERESSTDRDIASGEGWELLGGWRPIFDPQQFAAAVESYRPDTLAGVRETAT
jgi:UDP-glucose 4-epimerase